MDSNQQKKNKGFIAVIKLRENKKNNKKMRQNEIFYLIVKF